MARTRPRQPEKSAREAAAIGRRIVEQVEPSRAKKPKAPPPDTRKIYFARRPFGYGGQDLDREQILKLKGLINDEQIDRIGYIAEVPHGVTFVTCRSCGVQFLSMSARDAHARKRHEPPPPPPEMEPRQDEETETEYEDRKRAFLAQVQADEDARIEREEAEQNARAPLYLDRTEASLRG